MKYIVLLVSMFLMNTVYAWDGTVSGKIFKVDVTGGNNFGFRVTLEGAPALCGNGNTWAYVNESDSNYATFVSVLLAAKAQQTTVTLYANGKDGPAQGFCHIGYIAALR